MSSLPKLLCGYTLPGSASCEHKNITLECFIDLMCPCSCKLLKTITKDVIPDMKDKIRVVVYFYTQPWHYHGNVVNMAAIAVGQLNPGKISEFILKLATKHQEIGDSRLSRNYCDMVKFLEEIAVSVGIDHAKFHSTMMELESDERSMVVQELKYHTKIGRQNSIHVTPTVMVNGIIENKISSKWALHDWKEFINEVQESKIPVHPRI